MEEQERKLQEYEKQLAEHREQLKRLAADMNYLERQLAALKQEAGVTSEGARKATVTETIQQAVADLLPKQAVETFSTVENKAQEFRKKDLEKTVGKSLMGVFASVLIFISIILFATLLLPYFNDTAKMVTTFVVSFAFTGFGLWKLQKDKENKFYIAVTGCGMGAVYISLLLSNFYFGAVGDIALYISIALWAVAVCFLAKLKNQVFQIIGQLGITIAMLFGCFLCITGADAVKFIALVIFYLGSSSVFYLVHREQEFAKNRLHYIFNGIDLWTLCVGCHFLVGEGLHLVSGLVLCIVLAYLVFMLCHRLEKTGLCFGILLSAYAFLACLLLALIFYSNYLAFAVTGYLLCGVLMGILEWKMQERSIGHNLAQGFLIWLAVYCLNEAELLYLHGLAVLVIFPLLIVGYLRKNKVFRYGSMVVFAFGYIFMDDHGVAECFITGSAVLTAAFYLMFRFKEQYSRLYKWLVHGLSVLFLLVCVPDVVRLFTDDSAIRIAVGYSVWTLFNVAMVKSAFGRNLQTGETEKNTLYHIINLFAMIFGTIFIGVNAGEVLHLLVIVATLAAFMVNAKNLLDKRENLFAGIYVGIKFTVLMITILGSFDTVNYVVSIACFILAIVSIAIGFRAEYRSLRLFGLALSVISTFKLIMVDISYNNTLGNAFSFFASGVLCFVISMIYNYIAKKGTKEEE